MSRSSWKFLTIYKNDFIDYFNLLINDSYKYKYKYIYRNKTINYWNYRFFYKIYQGKYTKRIIFLKYHLGLKVGMFSKTRKPFFFRGKKKR